MQNSVSGNSKEKKKTEYKSAWDLKKEDIKIHTQRLRFDCKWGKCCRNTVCLVRQGARQYLGQADPADRGKL